MANSKGSPVAQSFKFQDDCFITGVDLYFSSVDLVNNKVWAEIRTMVNGYPTEYSLGHVDFLTSDITTSIDASVAHHIEFTYPIFTSNANEYCIVVGGWSPATRIWIAHVTDSLVGQPDVVHEGVPGDLGTLGTFFRSQNGSTWTAEQYDDMKYKVYIADFAPGQMDLVYNIEAEAEELGTDPFETEADMSKVRVYIEDHGLLKGDSLTISLHNNHVYRLTIPGGVLVSGQEVVGATSGAVGKIKQLTVFAENSKYDVTIVDTIGVFVEGETVTCKALVVSDAAGNVVYNANQITAVISYTPNLTEINGVLLSELSSTVTVESVDSKDSFIIAINSTPDETGRFGGTGVRAWPNLRYEIFNVSGSYDLYGGSDTLEFNGVYHNQTNGPFDSYNYSSTGPLRIRAGLDMYNNIPLKLPNDIMAAEKGVDTGLLSHSLLAGTRPRGTTADESFTALPSGGTKTSPVVNTRSWSVVLVTNKIDTEEQEADGPNAAGRYVAETDASQGTHAFKYVTKTVTLAQPAVDLKIAIGVYRDADADFDIYVKTLEQYAATGIDDELWRLVDIPLKSVSANLTEVVEYNLNASDVVAGWAGEFIAFKIKVVGRTFNPAKPPTFESLRVIAFT